MGRFAATKFLKMQMVIPSIDPTPINRLIDFNALMQVMLD